MPQHNKRFRIERGTAAVGQFRAAVSDQTPHPRSDDEQSGDGERRLLHAEPPGWPEGQVNVSRLAADLHAMRAATVAAKVEIAGLQRSPSGLDGIQRAAGELDAVSTATERATSTILTAVEEIEVAANVMHSADPDPLQRESLSVILDRVILLYEACNFQDIAGQRIRKVVSTLNFVEERLERVASVLATPASPGAPPSRSVHLAPSAELQGPPLPSDEGHVSQSDVDAFFA